MIFTIDLPPRLSDLYTNVPGRGRVKTATYREYQKYTIRDIRTQVALQRKFWPKGDGLYALDVWAYLKDHRITDADNRIKAAQDTLATALDFNDNLVMDVCAHKRVIPDLLVRGPDGLREICVVRFAASHMVEGPIHDAREMLRRASYA